MKKGWETLPLSEVCRTFQYGTSAKSSKEGTHPVLRMGNIQGERISWENLKYTSNKDEIAKYGLETNDILFNRTNSPELVGKSAIYDGTREALHAGYLIRVQVICGRLSAHFLNYYLNSPKTREHGFSVMSSSVNQANINASKLKAYLINLPSLSEQEEIVEILDKAFAAIDQAKANIEHNIANAKELFQSKLNQIFSHKGEGWVEMTLGEVCENLDRQRIPITKDKRTEGAIPYYGASGIVDYVADYIFDEDLLLVSEDGANLLARTYPIAFSISGKAWVNNHAHVLRFKDTASQIFIEYYLNSIRLDDYISGMAQPKLNQKKLNSITVPFPDLPQLRETVSAIEALDSELKKLSSANQAKLASLDELKKSILQKAFAGELT